MPPDLVGRPIPYIEEPVQHHEHISYAP
jgi:hypothetical protein